MIVGGQVGTRKAMPILHMPCVQRRALRAQIVLLLFCQLLKSG